jgi:hypothetical protein
MTPNFCFRDEFLYTIEECESAHPLDLSRTNQKEQYRWQRQNWDVR